MGTNMALLTPDQILKQIQLCRVELAELKIALRAVRSIERAKQAHLTRQRTACREAVAND
jgi:hypothetical protein